MKKIRAIYAFCTLFCVLGIAACGFTPLYSDHQTQTGATIAITDDLATIRIENIPDREGLYLRNALIDRFYKTGYPQNPRYTLTVGPVRETRTELDITKTADSTRSQLKLRSTFVLRDLTTNKTLLQRNILAITSYNTLQSQFTTRVSAENARQNALDDLARQIELQLSLYFHRDISQ